MGGKRENTSSRSKSFAYFDKLPPLGEISEPPVLESIICEKSFLNDDSVFSDLPELEDIPLSLPSPSVNDLPSFIGTDCLNRVPTRVQTRSSRRFNPIKLK